MCRWREKHYVLVSKSHKKQQKEMARFSALFVFVAGALLAFAAAVSAAAAPLSRDATSAPRLEQRSRNLREAESELINVAGAVGEAYGEAVGVALLGQQQGRRRSRSLRSAELVGEALAEAGEAFGIFGRG
jgi:hypothetical protein